MHLMWPAEPEVMVSPLCLLAARKIVRGQSFTRPWYSLVVDEDVKKPNQQKHRRQRNSYSRE